MARKIMSVGAARAAITPFLECAEETYIIDGIAATADATAKRMNVAPQVGRLFLTTRAIYYWIDGDLGPGTRIPLEGVSNAWIEGRGSFGMRILNVTVSPSPEHSEGTTLRFDANKKVAAKITEAVASVEASRVTVSPAEVERASRGVDVALRIIDAERDGGFKAVVDVVESDGVTDQDLWSAQLSFLGVAREFPEIGMAFIENMPETPELIVPTLRSAARTIATGDPDVYRPDTASGQVVVLTLLARFIGVHDDAMATLTAMRDGLK